MRVLVFEQWSGGHYFNYLEHLLPGLARLADEVVVALHREAMASREFEAKLGHCRQLANLRFEACLPPADPALPIGQRLPLLMNLRQAVARFRPDYLLVPSADAQTLAMGALGHLGIDLLPRQLISEATFHCGYGPAIRSRKQAAKEAVYRLAYAGCTWSRLNFVNFLYYEHALGRRCRWVRRARLVPDPVPRLARLSKAAARRRLGIPADGRYIGLLGSLDGRKAIPELLAAFRAAKLGAADRLLLAGRLHPAYRQLLENDYRELLGKGRIILLDRFLDEEELLDGYSALDLVSATYRDFPGLASLLLKGVAAGRPVVAQDFGWSAALIRRFGLGGVADIFDPGAFARTLTAELEASADYRESEATRRLLEFHAPENFTAAMLENLQRLTGHPPAAAPRSWDWVLEALAPAARQVR